MELRQNQWYIVTQNINYQRLARIYDEEQRETINRLMKHGFIPLKTTAGKGRCTRKRWNVEKYQGRNGIGFRMISSYVRPHTLGGYVRCNLNSITYFIKTGDAQ